MAKSALDKFNEVRETESAFLITAYKGIISDPAYSIFCKEGKRFLTKDSFIHNLEEHEREMKRLGYIILCSRESDDTAELGGITEKKTLDGLMLDPGKVISASVQSLSDQGRAVIYLDSEIIMQPMFYVTEEGIERKLEENKKRIRNAGTDELYYPILTELYTQLLMQTLQDVPRKFIADLIDYESRMEEDDDQNDIPTIPPDIESVRTLQRSLPPELSYETPAEYLTERGKLHYMKTQDALGAFARELRMKEEIYKIAISMEVLDTIGVDTTDYPPEGLAPSIYFIKSTSKRRKDSFLKEWHENTYYEKGLKAFSKQCQDLPVRKTTDLI